MDIGHPIFKQSLIRFIAVMHADTDGIVPGNALVVSFKIVFFYDI